MLAPDSGSNDGTVREHGTGSAPAQRMGGLPAPWPPERNRLGLWDLVTWEHLESRVKAAERRSDGHAWKQAWSKRQGAGPQNYVVPQSEDAA